MPPDRHVRPFDVLWLLLVGGLSAAWCVTAAAHLGATFDEPTHLLAGVESWRSGSNKRLMTWGAMPLPIDAQTLPIYLWERVRGEPVNVLGEMDAVLPAARAVTLGWWWLLLLYVLRWGRLVGGAWAGRLAVALVATDPNLLGHASLATTDICLTSLVLVAAYHWFVARDLPWKRRVLVPGLLYGVALLAKASALPYVPLLYLVFGLHHLATAGRLTAATVGPVLGRLEYLWSATADLRRDLTQIIPIGLAVAFVYCGCDWVAEPTFVAWASGLPAGPLRGVLLPLAENLAIFPNAGEGLVQQIKHNVRGHDGAFILGEYHPRAVWWYFPALLSVKLADPTLALLAAVLVLRPRTLLSPAGWAAAVLLLFSLNTRVQIGVRLVFPLVVFLLVALAAASQKGWLTRVLAWAAVGWTAWVSAGVWPDGVRHVNRLRGDPADGWQFVSDSNFDWGQGLPELRDWWAANGQPDLHVWYYGIDPSILKPPFRILLVNQQPNPSVDGVRAVIGDGYFAVSVSVLAACPDRRPETLAVVEWLKRLEPVGRTGTFVIYRLP